jgi:hypothetical protein
VDEAVSGEKKMRLRYAANCRVCGVELPAKTQAVYERSTKTVRCLQHDEAAGPAEVLPEVVDPGVPGASARREFARRHAKREQRIRTQHPRLGGLIHALSDDPQSTRAWDTGADGEEALGRRLNELVSETLLVLHDRRVRGTRANIDHLAVTPTGVYVIDAKKYRGRPRLRVEGGFFRPRVERLLVGSRDRTKLVDGVLKQVEVVRSALDDTVQVRGVLCFVEADFPLFGGSFRTRDVEVLRPRKLYALLRQPGREAGHALNEIHRNLAAALPSA